MSTTRQQFYLHLAQTSPAPVALQVERASGIFLYDESGKEYLDLISGISVSSMGHNCEPVLNAIRKQIDHHLHLMVYGEFIQSPQVNLATRLSTLLPSSLSTVYFTNSGTEATEGALKLAKRFTGRTGIISFRNAYHGSTQGALSVCGNEELKNAFRPLLPDVTILNFNEISQLSSITNRTACVIVEPIQGEAGIIIPESDFLTALSKRCKETGALLIFDEIQSGMGRTGKLFAFEHFGIVPDILLLGKAFGGGMPLGAFISSPEIMSSLTNNPALGHLTTFGGHPVSCAAALACLEEILKPGILDRVTALEKVFKSALQHPKVKSIKGKGLFLALEFENADLCHLLVQRCMENGLITDWFLFAPNCLRISPPLIINEEQTRKACGIIINILNSF